MFAGTAGTAAAQQADALPRPPGVRIVSLPKEPIGQPAEAMVAVNPRDPRHVIVSYQQHISFGPPFGTDSVSRLDAQVAWSADGGESRTIGSGSAPKNYLVSGDPTVTFDLRGHAFLAYIAFDHTG